MADLKILSGPHIGAYVSIFLLIIRYGALVIFEPRLKVRMTSGCALLKSLTYV